MVKTFSTLVSPVLLASTLAVAGTPVDRLIGNGEKMCFARTYTEAHMAAHPGQVARNVVFQLDRTQGTADRSGQHVVTARLGASVRTAQFSNFMFCGEELENGLLRCGVPCDGGSVSVGRGSDGEFYLYNNGVTLSGGCDGGDNYFMKADKENSVFKLNEVPCL